MKKGFTLIELILTVLILAVSVGGALTVLGGMVRHSRDAERQTLTVLHARMRMEEILSKRFDELPGDWTTCTFTAPTLLRFDAGETAANYDDVDDLNGWLGEVSSDPLLGKGLSSRVTVSYVTVDEGVFGSVRTSASSTCSKRITVEVLDAGTGLVLARVRSVATPFK